ncbi:zinc-dependent alcohol dehydrogenase family protein [Microbacterium luteolum]|nr:NADP-dependent oxidoreductase [Microbacterium luteolum]
MTKAEQMQAVVLDRFGGIEELHLRSIAVPQVGDHDVLIEVQAAGVGSWDATEREGGYDGVFGVASAFPYVLGWDGAGVVAQVGDAVQDFVPGDRVYAASTPVPRGGFYARFAVVPEAHVSPVPAGLPIEEAGALAWDAVTAQSGVDLLNPAEGSTVIVFGASGGIGHLALQFARLRGARTIAVASGHDGIELSRELGADLAFDGRVDDIEAAVRNFAPDGADAALITAGGAGALAALRGVKPSGRVAVPHGVRLDPAVDDARVQYYDGDRRQAALRRVSEAVESGALRLHLAHRFDLDQVREAHRMLAGHHLGKIVLRI